MINFFKPINLAPVFFFLSTCAFSQYYDTGYNTNYFGIYNLNASKYRIIKTALNLNPHKKIKRVFNDNGELIEELIFINEKLVSGIEYFVNSKFPFLKVPRSFKVEKVIINHNMSKYYCTQITSSLTKYLPESQEISLKRRIYNQEGQDFYIIDITAGFSKLYFK